jgi:hypothetical protein
MLNYDVYNPQGFFNYPGECFNECPSPSGDTFVFDANSTRDCASCLSVLNSHSINFTGNGSICNPLQANVNISQALGNNLLVMADGLYASGGSSVIPGGSNTQIQFNDNGVFGGDPNFTWDGSTFIIDYGANGSHQFDDNGYTFLFSNSGDNEFIINKGFFQYRVSNNLLISSDPTTAIFETSTGDGLYCTPGDATIGTASAWIEFTESNQLAEIFGTGGLLIDNLAGSGTRMVVVSSTGLLSTQAIPTSPVTSVFGRTGNVVLLSADVTGALGFTPTPNTRLITSTSPLSGGGALTSDLTLSIANAKADGVTLGAASFTASDFNDNGSGLISIDYTNGQKATTSQPGFLSSNDWNTFNNKPSVVDIQIFNSNGSFTWTKPAGAKWVSVSCIGAGGAGAGGGLAATTTSSGVGGYGGSGGAWAQMGFPAGMLGATETVVVGKGGTGGIAQTVSGGGATPGSAGTNSVFGKWIFAPGGGAGSGINSNGPQGLFNVAAASATILGAAGGARLNSLSLSFLGGSGGGVGGFVTVTTGALTPGGPGGNVGNTMALAAQGQVGYADTLLGGAAGIAGNAGDGQPGQSFGTSSSYGGSGGGGGVAWNGSGGRAGNGGLGGFPGGGGGGAGAGVNGLATAGTGGNGADGIVIVTTFF